MKVKEAEAVKLTRLTVSLPAETHRRLKHRAQGEHRSLDQVIIAAVEQWLAEEEKPELSEHERIRQVLRENGMLAELGDWVDEYIEAAPDATIEEVRELWRGRRPLSEDIIADRGER